MRRDQNSRKPRIESMTLPMKTLTEGGSFCNSGQCHSEAQFGDFAGFPCLLKFCSSARKAYSICFDFAMIAELQNCGALDAAGPARFERRCAACPQIGESGAFAGWRLPRMLQECKCRPAPGRLPANWREWMATSRMLQEHRTDRHRTGCLKIGESGALAGWRLPGCSRNAGPTATGRAASKLQRAAPLQDGDSQDAPGTQDRPAQGGLPPNWREWRLCRMATSMMLQNTRPTGIERAAS